MNGKTLTFLRDDDVYKYDNNFLSVFSLLKKYKIPVILGIIPKTIDKELVDFLNNEKKDNTYRFNIVQHGWSHRNYNKDIKNKYEFGPLRPYQQQKKDIKEGYARMKALFGENFTPAFVPPYHGYDNNTIEIINELGIPLFSAGEKTGTKTKTFLDLPADISLNDYDPKGTPLPLSAERLIKNVASYMINRIFCGMVFHHQAIKNNYQLRHFKTFVKFLRTREKEGLIKITLFDRLISKKLEQNKIRR